MEISESFTQDFIEQSNLKVGGENPEITSSSSSNKSIQIPEKSEEILEKGLIPFEGNKEQTVDTSIISPEVYLIDKIAELDSAATYFYILGEIQTQIEQQKMAKAGEDAQRASNMLKLQERLLSKSSRNKMLNKNNNENIEESSGGMMFTPVRFNILGQMEIPQAAQNTGQNNPNQMGSPPSNSSPHCNSNTNGSQNATIMGMGLNHINSAFLHHQAHFGLGLGLHQSPHFQHQIIHNNSNSPHANDPLNSQNNTEEDSPLDFSKKKQKLDETNDQCKSPVSVDSPSSRLRNILSMKSPSPSSFNDDMMAEGALNLAKDSPNSSRSDSRESSNCSPLSPGGLVDSRGLVTSPKPAINPVSINVPGGQSQGQSIFSNSNGGGGGAHYPLSFSPWGNGVFSPSLSPNVNQSAAVPTGPGLPLSMEPSPSMFPFQVGTSNTSPGATGANFSPSIQVPVSITNGTSNNGTKGRGATRPFKAYPKDPMSFPTVSMYGLPLGATPGGGNDALLHQQAYAEFRKQMLVTAQLGRTRRGSQKNGAHHSNSDSSNEGLTFGGISMENMEQMDESSPENLNSNGKSRLGKSEQQMKDEAYWERRRKNNEAAKRSRDARRAKEDEIAIRAAFLEQENLKLRFELCALKNETAKLRCMLYST